MKLEKREVAEDSRKFRYVPKKHPQILLRKGIKIIFQNIGIVSLCFLGNIT